MYVVVIGEIFGMKTVHGPFNDSVSAERWIAKINTRQHAEIIKLHPAY